MFHGLRCGSGAGQDDDRGDAERIREKFVDWLNSMDEGTRKVIVTIALVAAAIGPILIIVGKVISAVGTQYGSGRRRCCRGYRDPGIYRR